MTTNGHRNRLTQKQETFCRLYFELGNGKEAALAAGYSPRTAKVIASENLSKPYLMEIIETLRQQAVDKSIGTVQERQQRLTEIYRARLTDFMTLGADGSWIDVGPENPHAGAIQEITSKTEYDENGEHPTVVTKVKLHDPVKAIAEQNKMDKIYSDNPVVNVDNRSLTVNVVSPEGKTLLEEVIEGSGTEKEKE